MKEKILILVKTYPTFSKKYFELVCTAGINEKGEWRRIYPIPFRTLIESEKYKKYQYIEVDIQRNKQDPRPESYKLTPQTTIKILNEISTKNSWQRRKNILFKNNQVFDNLSEIIQKANNNELSLAIFKPKNIANFTFEQDSSIWNQKVLDCIEKENKQPNLFPELKREIKLVKKLPYKFSYEFEDEEGKKSKLMIEDWEIGQLYWNCLKKHQNKQKALNDVVKKYKDYFLQRDIYLFLGTTRQFHGWAKNPFVIIGVFYPPKINQVGLL